jgi:hypothetical protein
MTDISLGLQKIAEEMVSGMGLGDFGRDDFALLIGDLEYSALMQVKESLLSLNVSYSMNMVTQVTATLLDPNFTMTRNNYFVVGRTVQYATTRWLGSAYQDDGKFYGNASLDYRNDHDWRAQLLEIASVQVGPGPGSSPVVTIEMRTKAVQQMRRDKNPGSIKANGSDWVIAVAEKYGLFHQVQKTSKKKNINKASGDQQADSTWTVLENLASDAKFLLFESDSILFFVSQYRLIGKWGATQVELDYVDPQTNKSAILPFNVVPLEWPPRISDGDPNIKKIFDSTRGAFQLFQCPQLRQSEDDPLAADGSAQIDYVSGAALRPGMTVLIFGVPMFENRPFLITEVSFDHLSRDSVNISFASPEREDGKIVPYEVGTIYPAQP